MADYIYLLENRLSGAQRAALQLLRELAAERALTLFLVGGAVRDLTSGSPVRDLDFVVQGDALALRADLEQAGAEITGEQPALQTLYLTMPGGVRAELGSTLGATWPKPGKPVFQPATLGEDLRRRDFTANAMALSLNEGSYGLLIDPLNGVADIENRQLRLVSNYGFIEEPVRMIRAVRLMARLGWELEEKTQTRFQTGQQEGYVSALSDFQRGYELEEIFHEEDPMRVLRRLEAEGWMKDLAPYWVTAKINTADLDRLRETQMMLQLQGIIAEGGAAGFPLLTAKMSAKEQATLKASFPRQGFAREIDALEGEAKEFLTQLSGKAGASASAGWKLITSARPEAVLQGAFSSRSPAVQAKFKAFSSEWPQARQRIPYALMQEMRIVPELDGYAALLETLFFELMDGRLVTPEEMRAFLEPYSPPAPPPPVSLRRARGGKKDAKPARSRAKKGKAEEDPEESHAGTEEEAEDRSTLTKGDQFDGLLDEVDEKPEDTDQDEDAEMQEPSEPEVEQSTAAPKDDERRSRKSSSIRVALKPSPVMQAEVTPAIPPGKSAGATKPVAVATPGKAAKPLSKAAGKPESKTGLSTSEQRKPAKVPAKGEATPRTTISAQAATRTSSKSAPAKSASKPKPPIKVEAVAHPVKTKVRGRQGVPSTSARGETPVVAGKAAKPPAKAAAGRPETAQSGKGTKAAGKKTAAKPVKRR